MLGKFEARLKAHVVVVLLAATIVTSGAVASSCSTFSSSNDPLNNPDGGDEASSSVGQTCSPACASGQTCVNGACIQGCAERIVYVSPSGNDGDTGCAKEKPKATIGSALGLLKTLGAKDHEIHACRGTFKETITIDQPTILRGGYECSLWTRTPSYGFVGFGGADINTHALGFDRSNETRIEGINGSSATLTVSGSVIEASTLVDGVTVLGIGGAGAGTAVAVLGGARPTLANNEFIGAVEPSQSTTAPYASGGIFILSAGPTITKNRINGGAGSKLANGGVGIAIQNSLDDLVIQENEITTTEGSGSFFSNVGISVAGAQSKIKQPISKNHFFWGGAIAGGVTGSAIVITDTAGELITISDNILVGGVHDCTNGAEVCVAGGIMTTDPALRTLIARNRIFMGTTAVPNITPMDFRAVQIMNAIEASVVDNQILLRGAKVQIGVNGNKVERIDVVGNTIFIGQTGAKNQHVLLSGITSEANVINNLLLATPSSNTTAVTTYSCSKMKVNMKNNAFVVGTSTSTLLRDFGGSNADNCASDIKVASGVLAAEILGSSKFLGGEAIGNTEITGACEPSSPNCKAIAACAETNGCPATVINAWDAATTGLSTLIGADGWKLSATAPCLVTSKGFVVPSALASGAASTDAYGATRTVPWSIGAHEGSELSCTP